METETHDDLLALHHSRLIGWLVEVFARSLMLGAGVGLIIGTVAWVEGNSGWVVASPGVGLVVFAGCLWFSRAPMPIEP